MKSVVVFYALLIALLLVMNSMNSNVRAYESSSNIKLGFDCPRNCSGNGSCNAGICTCNSNFWGTDCSFEEIQGFQTSVIVLSTFIGIFVIVYCSWCVVRHRRRRSRLLQVRAMLRNALLREEEEEANREPVIMSIKPLKEDEASFIFASAEDRTCCVCMDGAVDLSLQPCGHLLCQHCAMKIFFKSPTCPFCRQGVEECKQVIRFKPPPERQPTPPVTRSDSVYHVEGV